MMLTYDIAESYLVRERKDAGIELSLGFLRFIARTVLVHFRVQQLQMEKTTFLHTPNTLVGNVVHTAFVCFISTTAIVETIQIPFYALVVNTEMSDRVQFSFIDSKSLLSNLRN